MMAKDSSAVQRLKSRRKPVRVEDSLEMLVYLETEESLDRIARNRFSLTSLS